jgi:hypothetical protein
MPKTEDPDSDDDDDDDDDDQQQQDQNDMPSSDAGYVRTLWAIKGAISYQQIRIVQPIPSAVL